MDLYKSSIQTVENEEDNTRTNENIKAKRMRTGFLLAAAYSASIGGLGSLVGTAPNVLGK
jgi:di/tricarboxylate transporter